MIGVIVAMNADRVIGVNGTIPWRYPGDLRRFKEVTAGSTVIMGRKTWESIPPKFRPLIGRDNCIVSSTLRHEPLKPWGVYADVPAAMAWAHSIEEHHSVWFIGGARIYAEAMQYANVIDVTHVPWRGWKTQQEYYDFAQMYDDIVRFPPIDETVFAPGDVTAHPYEPELRLQRFERRYGLKDNELLRQQGVLRQ